MNQLPDQKPNLERSRGVFASVSLDKGSLAPSYKAFKCITIESARLVCVAVRTYVRVSHTASWRFITSFLHLYIRSTDLAQCQIVADELASCTVQRCANSARFIRTVVYNVFVSRKLSFCASRYFVLLDTKLRLTSISCKRRDSLQYPTEQNIKIRKCSFELKKKRNFIRHNSNRLKKKYPCYG